MAFFLCVIREMFILYQKVKIAKNVHQIRGVSITPISARLFELIMHRKKICNNILLRGDPLQFAYKKGMSTIDYLLLFQFNIFSYLDIKFVDGVHVKAVDFSMAFDTVDQELVAQECTRFIDSQYISKWLYSV